MTPLTPVTVPQIPTSCPHQPQCPACPRFGSDAPAPVAVAELEALAQQFGIRLKSELGARAGFRRRARLSVRGRIKSPKVGVFEARSHRVADIAHCSVHHPVINWIVKTFKSSMQALKVPAYSDDAHAGLIRGIQVVVQRPDNRVQLTVICNARDSSSALPLFQDLQQRLGSNLHSLWWNGNDERTNRVLGPHWESICGPEAIEENLGGARVFFPPGAFGQNNLDLFDRLLAQVHRWVPDNSEVIELYCGSGSIGLGLMPRVSSLVFNEIGPASLTGLEMGLAALPEELRRKANVVPGPAEILASRLQTQNTVIVDPPRKGLDPGILQSLAKSPPQHLIYVSCGLTSFLHDARQLARAGLVPQQLSLYDLFPFTDHVETVSLFRPST